MFLYAKKKKKKSNDYIKNLETGRLAWIVQVGPRCKHLHPQKREVDGDLITEEKARWPWRLSLEGCGPKPRTVTGTRNWKV